MKRKLAYDLPVVQVRCPHCDSRNVEQMADRSYEATATNTWHQCRDCRRMWALAKDDTSKPEEPEPSHANSFNRARELMDTSEALCRTSEELRQDADAILDDIGIKSDHKDRPLKAEPTHLNKHRKRA